MLHDEVGDVKKKPIPQLTYLAPTWCRIAWKPPSQITGNALKYLPTLINKSFRRRASTSYVSCIKHCRTRTLLSAKESTHMYEKT